MSLNELEEKDTPENTNDPETVEEGSEITSEESDIDYKAELEKAQEEKRKISGALAEERRLRKEAQQAATDKPADTDALVEDIYGKLEKRRADDEVDEVIESMTSNSDEQALIKELYTNRLKPTGFSRKAIKADIESAYLLANRSKFLTDAEKKARKALAEEKALKDNQGSPKSKTEKGEKKENWSLFTQEEKDLLKRRGLKPSDVK